MSSIIKLFKLAYGVSKTVVTFFGVLLLIMLVTQAIVYLEGITPKDINLPISEILNSESMAWVWCAIFIVYAGGFLVDVIKWVRKTIIKARDKSVKPEEKVGGVLNWLLNH